MKTRQAITATIFDKKGRVLSIGQNSYIKTHPLQKHHAERVGMSEKIYCHAEIAAIIRCKDLSKAHKMLVTRFNSQGLPVIAKPCEICQSAINASGITNVVHT